MDDDGYPTEEELALLEKWPDIAPVEWFAFARQMWHWPDWGWEEGNCTFSTGGWSGNESIVFAMRKNPMWKEYVPFKRRGGHYTRYVPGPPPSTTNPEDRHYEHALGVAAWGWICYSCSGHHPHVSELVGHEFPQPSWAIGQIVRETGLTENTCEHGIGHPHTKSVENMGRVYGVHGCDGCCSKEQANGE